MPYYLSKSLLIDCMHNRYNCIILAYFNWPQIGIGANIHRSWVQPDKYHKWRVASDERWVMSDELFRVWIWIQVRASSSVFKCAVEGSLWLFHSLAMTRFLVMSHVWTVMEHLIICDNILEKVLSHSTHVSAKCLKSSWVLFRVGLG